MDFSVVPDTSDFLERSDELICDLASKVGEALNQPVCTGVFSGCAGRLVGSPDVSTAICFVLDPLPAEGDFMAAVWCLESPANRLIFFRRPMTEGCTRNLKQVLSSLDSILASDSRVKDLRWMDVEEWAKGEQAEDGDPSKRPC
ncbi:MAG: hypothetical protein WBG04_07205 [Haloferula sp.]